MVNRILFKRMFVCLLISSIIVGINNASRKNSLSKITPYASYIRQSSLEHKVPEKLIWVIIKHESGGNPLAVSPKGAKGLMQLMDGTAYELGVDPFDPEQNIDGGTRHLRDLLETYNGDVKLSAAAYNCGRQRVINKVPDIPETQVFADNVVADFGKQYIKLN